MTDAAARIHRGDRQRGGCVATLRAGAAAGHAGGRIAIMGSLVPSFSLSGLRAAFSASWNWSNRPAYQFKIRHQFELGGFDVKAGLWASSSDAAIVVAPTAAGRLLG